MKNKMKNLRLELNKTQAEVAIELGIPRTKYARYETGESDPSTNTLLHLAEYFHTTTDNLLGHEVPYLLDKSTLSPEHKELLDFILELTPAECIGAKAAIIGWLIAENNKQQIINKFKKGE